MKIVSNWFDEKRFFINFNIKHITKLLVVSRKKKKKKFLLIKLQSYRIIGIIHNGMNFVK